MAATSPIDAFFSSFSVGKLSLPNRVVMAPLTRGRAARDGTPNVALASQYYVQRASAGLIVSEATAVSRQGSGWVGAPGIYTDAHVAAWRSIVDAVHAAGGRIFLQLWHMGRVSHPSFQVDNQLPVAPSAVAAQGETHTYDGKKPYVVPRALELAEIEATVRDYAAAARNAIAAGFDGIEVHGANGYLVDQFLRDGSNHRTDRYGGSVENRARFLLEIVDAIAAEIGADRVGVRVSPTGLYNDMKDSDPVALYTFVASALSDRSIAYLHSTEGLPGSWMYNPDAPTVTPHLRASFKGALIVNGGYNATSGAEALSSGATDLVAYGSAWISNPDLVRRIRIGAEWALANMATFYSAGPEGYIDYPALPEEVSA